IPISFIPVSIIFITLYFGLKPSLYYTFIGGILEIGFLIAAAMVIIIKVGPNNTFIPFLPSTGISFANIGFGILYAILSFVGINQVVMLSEEAKLPKKNVPLAIVTSFIMTAVTFLLISYALVVGWGISSFSSFSTTTNPGFVVVGKYLGLPGLIVFMIITFNSFISNGIAEGNSFTRAGFALARDNLILPKSFTKLNKYGSPIRVLALIFLSTILLTYGLGIYVGPFLAGTIVAGFNAVFLYLIHIFINSSLPTFAYKLKVKMKNIAILILVSLISTIIYLFAVVTVFYPLPAFPYLLETYGDIAVFLAGIVIVIYLVVTKGKEYMASIGIQKEEYTD
ncbi:MAG: APC family permease, partial [Nitrososphaeria archaeon]